MSTVHDYFKSLYVGGTFAKPENISRNAIEYAVHGPSRGYARQYNHLANGRVVWIDSKQFRIQCRSCAA